MKHIYLFYHNLTQSVQSVKGLYEIISLGLRFILFLIVSIITTNHTVELWSSLFLGFTTALIFAKLPAIIAYFKGSKQKAV